MASVPFNKFRAKSIVRVRNTMAEDTDINRIQTHRDETDKLPDNLQTATDSDPYNRLIEKGRHRKHDIDSSNLNMSLVK